MRLCKLCFQCLDRHLIKIIGGKKNEKVCSIIVDARFDLFPRACGAEGGVKDDEAAGPGSFKIGTLDTGSADATTAPLLNQLKLTVETLGCELVTATSTGMSAEETLVALQNLIAAGCDAILVPAAMISPAKVAEICDPEGVYWGTYFYKFEEGTEDYEAAMNSEYFVGTTYEDDVDSAYWQPVSGNWGARICA